MGYPTKVQLISRKKTADQYYINFPSAIAEAMGFSKGERVEWEIHNRCTMVLQRPDAPPSPLEKKNGRLAGQVLAILSEQAGAAAEGEYQGELAQHMLAHLLCTQRHTITGLLGTASHRQRSANHLHPIQAHCECPMASGRRKSRCPGCGYCPLASSKTQKRAVALHQASLPGLYRCKHPRAGSDSGVLLALGYRGELQGAKATLWRGRGPGTQRGKRSLSPSGLHRLVCRIAARRCSHLWL